MAHEVRELTIARLLLDQSNARLGEEQPNQQTTQIALAERLGDQLFVLAEDILENGMDPTTLPAVTRYGARQYRVLEGNRRVLTLKCLETPSLLDSVLSSAKRRRWERIAQEFSANRITKVACVVFDTEDEARHWIELRHTGANSGAGLVEWDSNEQDRYQARHGGVKKRTPAGQIIDFVERVDPPGEDASNRYITTLQRLVNTAEVRDALGIQISDGDVYSWFPGIQVAISLQKVVNDLRYGRKDVTDLYYKQGRLDYVASFSEQDLPANDTRLDTPVKLSDLGIELDHVGSEMGVGSSAEGEGGRVDPSTEAVETGEGNDSPVGGQAGSGLASSSHSSPVTGPPAGQSGSTSIRPSSQRQRSRVIPRACVLRIGSGRINNIYHELRNLDVDEFTNSASVILRVFIELSLDNFISRRKLMNDAEHKGASLAKKLKESAADLRANGKLTLQEERAVIRIADGVGPLAAATMNMHQFVHNEHVYPRPSELLTAWDEIEVLMRAIWAEP